MENSQIPLRQFSPPHQSAMNLELLIFDKQKQFDALAHPNRHTFYAIFFVSAGSGTHTIDFETYNIQPNSLFLVGPGTVHYRQIEKPLAEKGIVFESDIFADSAIHTQLNYLFRALNKKKGVCLDEQSADHFTHLLQQFQTEYEGEEFGREQALIALLHLLLIHIQRIQQADENDLPRIETGATRLTEQFLQLVETHAIEQRSIQTYADQLGITLSHLSESVKQVTGITTSQWVRQRVILEAKRLLLHTDATVSEIAYQLNFNDISYFGRFFKREVKMTPRTFRIKSQESTKNSK